MPTDDQQRQLVQTEAMIRQRFESEGSGHDVHHIMRVRRNARIIAEREGADLFIVEMAALLHDIADWKFHGGDLSAGPQAARAWMTEIGVPNAEQEEIAAIVAGVSFKGARVAETELPAAGKIVRDADRLDAIGAIGIARCFAYGGSVGHALYDPAEKPVLHDSAAAYVGSKGSSISHFYEKLLLLKARLHTPTARLLAEERHAFMEDFLKQFFSEWNGTDATK